MKEMAMFLKSLLKNLTLASLVIVIFGWSYSQSLLLVSQSIPLIIQFKNNKFFSDLWRI